MRHVKLGVIGVALVFLMVVSLILSALFCTFPWSMTVRRASAEDAVIAQSRIADPMTLIYADDDSTEAREQIDAGNAKLIQAWKTGNAEMFAECFAEDGVFMIPGRPPVLGRQAIHTHMRDVFSRLRMSEGTITTIDVYLLGSTAYETGKSEFEIGPIGKKPKKDTGHYVAVWKKEGTKWKMWRDIGVPKE